MNTFENSFGNKFYSNTQNPQPYFGLNIAEKQFKTDQYNQPQFGFSNKNNNINIKQFQFQQKIVLLKIQLHLMTIFNILSPKVLNNKKYVFKCLKQKQKTQQINYVKQKLIIQCGRQIFERLNNFKKSFQLRLVSKAFSRILMKNIEISKIQSYHIRNKKKPSDKRDSQILRINSKPEDSLRVSDLGVDAQYSNSINKKAKVKNKQLKKQKQKIDKDLNDFYSQMDKLLSSHQHYLKKK